MLLVRLLVLALIIGAAVNIHAASETLFELRDPSRDDYGDGLLSYPLDDTFPDGVLDLVGFVVKQDSDHITFQFHFAQTGNPWNAPEGFYHPRIDLFIDALEAVGRTDPMRPGPGEIRFDPSHPWDHWLRIAPWDGVALFRYDDAPDSPGHTEGTHVRLSEPHNVEVIIPRGLIPPLEHAHYYLLVGSFDALGIDGYREVSRSPSRWLLAGENPTLRIVDLLAPRRGPHSQVRQLRADASGSITLYPVSVTMGWGWWPYLIGTTVVMVTAYAFLRRRHT